MLKKTQFVDVAKGMNENDAHWLLQLRLLRFLSTLQNQVYVCLWENYSFVCINVDQTLGSSCTWNERKRPEVSMLSTQVILSFDVETKRVQIRVLWMWTRAAEQDGIAGR